MRPRDGKIINFKLCNPVLKAEKLRGWGLQVPGLEGQRGKWGGEGEGRSR